MRLFRSYFLLAFLILLTALGCSTSPTYDGPPLYTVSGKITENGTPPSMFDPTNTVVVAFAKMDGNKRPENVLRELGIQTEEASDDAAPPGGNPNGPAAAATPPERRVYEADVHEDGTYTAKIPKGKYVVVVRIFPEGKLAITGPANAADKLKGAFSVEKSSLVRDISGDMNFDLEIGRKK